MSATEAWWTLEATFVFLCILGGALFLLWVIAAIVSAWGCRLRRGSHRVGGVWKSGERHESQ